MPRPAPAPAATRASSPRRRPHGAPSDRLRVVPPPSRRRATSLRRRRARAAPTAASSARRQRSAATPQPAPAAPTAPRRSRSAPSRCSRCATPGPRCSRRCSARSAAPGWWRSPRRCASSATATCSCSASRASSDVAGFRGGAPGQSVSELLRARDRRRARRHGSSSSPGSSGPVAAAPPSRGAAAPTLSAPRPMPAHPAPQFRRRAVRAAAGPVVDADSPPRARPHRSSAAIDGGRRGSSGPARRGPVRRAPQRSRRRRPTRTGPGEQLGHTTTFRRSLDGVRRVAPRPVDSWATVAIPTDPEPTPASDRPPSCRHGRRRTSARRRRCSARRRRAAVRPGSRARGGRRAVRRPSDAGSATSPATTEPPRLTGRHPARRGIEPVAAHPRPLHAPTAASSATARPWCARCSVRRSSKRSRRPRRPGFGERG